VKKYSSCDKKEGLSEQSGLSSKTNMLPFGGKLDLVLVTHSSK